MNGIQENLMSESVQNVIAHIGTRGRKKKLTHRCHYCKQDKPRGEFYKYLGKSGRFRLNPRCKSCGSAYTTELNAKRDYSKKKYAKRDQEKERIRALTRYRIKQGIIIPQPCELCGERGQVHHPDYSKPFEIRWLCTTHHGEQHRKYVYD